MSNFAEKNTKSQETCDLFLIMLYLYRINEYNKDQTRIAN